MPAVRSSARLALAFLLLLVATVLVDGPVSAAPVSGTRIVIYGDSITQGSSGDWTWRCRLWDHFVATGTPVDLVGPRFDLENWRTGALGSQEYGDPACDRDHASRWGMALTRSDYDLSDLLAAENADVLVALTGINDLAYGLASPADLVALLQHEILEARASNPDVAFVLVTVPDLWYPHVPEYNAALADLAAATDTATSRVVTTADAAFDKDRDTLDGVHPSANGEVRIAAVVADALAGIGIGAPWPQPLGLVPPAPWFAPAPQVTVDTTTLGVSWPVVDYADRMRVQWRDATTGSDWSVTDPLSGTSWSGPAEQGHAYDVRLQPVKGRLDGGTLSSVVTVRAPASPAAVTDLRARRLRGCRERLTWTPALYATGYEVWLRDRGGGAWGLASPGQVAGSRFDTGRLRRHHRYAAFVRSFGPLQGADSAPVRFRACG